MRRVLLMGGARGVAPVTMAGVSPQRAPWLVAAAAGALDARSMLAAYCAMLYQRLGSYEEVARITGLDRRTVKKYAHQQA